MIIFFGFELLAERGVNPEFGQMEIYDAGRKEACGKCGFRKSLFSRDRVSPNIDDSTDSMLYQQSTVFIQGPAFVSNREQLCGRRFFMCDQRSTHGFILRLSAEMTQSIAAKIVFLGH